VAIERLARPLHHRPVVRPQPFADILGTKSLVLLERALPLLIAAYLLFDRGFAWLHVPGTPLFAGELLIGLALVAMALATGYSRRALHQNPLMLVLVAFACWGLLRMVPLLGTYRLNAVRDAAIWYYAVVAVAVVTLSVAWPDLPERMAQRFGRFVPLLLAWSVVALLLAQVFPVSVSVPGSGGVSIFSHKTNNIAVNAAIALAFLWLMPAHALPRWPRHVLGLLSVAVIGVAGTQNRGGMVAALTVLALAGLLARQRLRLGASALGAALFVVALAWSMDLRVPSEGPREISVTQLAANIASISGSDGGDSDLAGTITWRSQLWTKIVSALSDEDRLVSGFGFGPNLGAGLGFPASVPGEPPLRSPHNSHLDILARMGLVGGFLWVALWAVWYQQLLSARRRLRIVGQHYAAGLAEVCLVAAAGILVNAVFDPTLESPQVAVFLWAVFGLGMVVANPRLTMLDAGAGRPRLAGTAGGGHRLSS
jgi:O-antigen ligase